MGLQGGKSTYLRSLNRMNDGIANTKVTGKIMYKEVDVNTKEVDVCEMRKRIGMVFQRPNLSVTINDNQQYHLCFETAWRAQQKEIR